MLAVPAVTASLWTSDVNLLQVASAAGGSPNPALAAGSIGSVTYNRPKITADLTTEEIKMQAY